MATSPFTLNITIPGDTDIVSQFPGVDRTHLDILNSWLKTDHNVNGTHNYSTYLQVGVADSGGNTASAPAPAANNTAIFRDTDGALKAKRGDDSSVEFLGGVPPGIGPLPYAGATLPTGWLWCDGSAVSRTTYARLFTAIGITYGPGDGSTTFNLPDADNRFILGKYRTTQRVSSAGSSIDGGTIAAAGGVQSISLISTNMPASVTFNDGSASVTNTSANVPVKTQGTPGSAIPVVIMPPTLVVGGMIIKY